MKDDIENVRGSVTGIVVGSKIKKTKCSHDLRHGGKGKRHSDTATWQSGYSRWPDASAVPHHDRWVAADAGRSLLVPEFRERELSVSLI